MEGRRGADRAGPGRAGPGRGRLLILLMTPPTSIGINSVSIKFELNLMIVLQWELATATPIHIA